MTKRETPIALAGMDQARRRLERWRATRVAGAAMPEKLWAMAVQLAQRHGIYPTSRTLGLEYNKLKRLAQRTNGAPKAPPLSPPTFVEVLAPMAATEPPCRIELEGQAGAKLRIELPASASAALVMELCELVWSIGSAFAAPVTVRPTGSTWAIPPGGARTRPPRSPPARSSKCWVIR